MSKTFASWPIFAQSSNTKITIIAAIIKAQLLNLPTDVIISENNPPIKVAQSVRFSNLWLIFRLSLNNSFLNLLIYFIISFPFIQCLPQSPVLSKLIYIFALDLVNSRQIFNPTYIILFFYTIMQLSIYLLLY